MVKEFASWSKRLINFIVDLMTAQFIVVLYYLMYGIYTAEVNGYDVYSKEFKGSIPLLISYVVYLMVLEYFTGKTLGKWITKSRVVSTDGRKLTFKQVVIRTLVRLTIIEWFSFLSKYPRGWHDSLSKTKVVDS